MSPAVQDPVLTDAGAPPRATDLTPTAGAAAAPLLDSVVRSAHDTIDRVAAKAAPAVERMVSGAQGASDAVHQRVHDAGELSHEWADTLRATVRDHPLASVAVAVAVGVLISRLAQGDGH
jgi:ElaB/YqjD/DUF883 family membrane-anchored ribosome-binding protein